ncbi:MAG: SLC26A/SulP transporter family protein [Elainellaceae cyanobacterium]
MALLWPFGFAFSPVLDRRSPVDAHAMTPQAVQSSSPPRWLQPLQANLQPSALLSSLPAGLITGVIGAIRAISYASLIFSGALATYLPTGLGITLFSTAVICALVALNSTLPGIIATPLAAPTALLAIMASDIAQELPSSAPGADLLATVWTAIALTTLLTGLLLLALGLFKQGERIRVVPYPVIGGFMAGTGWLLVKGFVQVVTDRPLNLTTLAALVQADTVALWLPGLGFALILLTVMRRFDQSWIMPATLLGCTGLFYLGLWGTHTTLEAARAQGLLLGPFPEGSGGLWHPITPDVLSQVRWEAIAHQTGSILTLAFVTLLSLLLSNSSIEVVVERDLNLSQEMRALGLGNLLSGLGGGMVGSQALPSTLLAHSMGAPHRLTGLVAALPSIAVLVIGSTFLAYLPKAILGCLLLYLGLSLLLRWVYDAYFKLPLADYLSVWATVVVIDAVGFLQGIAVGFVLIVLIFMYRYSQVDVVKQAISGATIRSNLDRPPWQERLLSQGGNHVYVLELQGFLFFGTANYLLRRVRDRAQPGASVPPEANAPPLRYVLIDFRQVSGLDSSAVLTFSKILRLARKQQFTLVLTNLAAEFEAELQAGADFDRQLDYCQVFPDIDRGLEWCEQQQLATAGDKPDAQADAQTPDTQKPDVQADAQKPNALETASAPASGEKSGTSVPSTKARLTPFLTPGQSARFMPYLEPQSLPPCYYIFRRGEEVSDLYFVESGQVSVLLETGEGHPKRLQTVSGGSVLGEMRFFGKVPLSTSVVTDAESRLHRLTQAAFDAMKKSDPDLAQALQAHIVTMLCDSLIRREEQLRVIQ